MPFEYDKCVRAFLLVEHLSLTVAAPEMPLDS